MIQSFILRYLFSPSSGNGEGGRSGRRARGGKGDVFDERNASDHASRRVLSDEDVILVDRIRRGDVEAFQSLFHAEWRSLCASAAIYTHDMDVAEELVATIFADLWLRHETLSITVKLRTYLHSAVKHRTMNWRRDRGRREKLIHDVVPIHVPGMASGAPLASAFVEQDDTVARALQVIDTLPTRYRLAFVYRWREEWEYADIAAALGVSINGAQALVSRALRMIRERLEE